MEELILTQLSQQQLNEKYRDLKGPAYICDLKLVERNMKIINKIQQDVGIKFIIALKGSSMPSTFDVCRQYLYGCAASGEYESRLAKEFGKEVHTFSPAFTDSNIGKILENSTHIVFNSVSQLHRFKHKAIEAGVHISLRVNPEYSSVTTALYDACMPNSRFGVTRTELTEGIQKHPDLLDGVSGVHCHALCMSMGDSLGGVLDSLTNNFKDILSKVHHLNCGGGTDVTDPNYKTQLLYDALYKFRIDNTNITDIYFESGNAILLDCGVLVGEVVDITKNDKNIAILNISPSCHAPDVLEMPYRANVLNETQTGKYEYILGAPTCLSGDVWGTYRFGNPLNIGDKVVFENMIVYSFCKNTTFNGIELPSLAIQDMDGHINIIREFNFETFRERLG